MTADSILEGARRAKGEVPGEAREGALPAEVAKLDETVAGWTKALVDTAGVLREAAESHAARESSLRELIERAERCAAGIEQLLSPPAWRSVLTGAGWALVGALAAILGMVGPLLRELAR